MAPSLKVPQGAISQPGGGFGFGVGGVTGAGVTGVDLVGPLATKASSFNILTKENIKSVIAGIQAGAVLKRGRESEEIAAERAAIDLANAEAVRRSSVERAKILASHRERLVERQKRQFISGNIRTNVGVPLLIEAQTVADITRDIGFDLEIGRVEAGQFRSSAAIEKKIGKAKRKRSRFEAIGIGAQRGISFLGLT